jgi:acyl-CoA synthetase (AMP-forming)/AMP-acid ligase II
LSATQVTLLLADAAVRRADFSSLELLSCGGAPLAPATVRAAVATFGCEFFLSYGMTECCGKIAMSLVDAAVRAELGPAGTLDLVCSSGRPFFLLDVRVVAGSASAAPADEDDAADVARGSGAVGEVRIRAELKSSTRLQCERMRRFRRELFCRASRTQ